MPIARPAPRPAFWAVVESGPALADAERVSVVTGGGGEYSVSQVPDVTLKKRVSVLAYAVTWRLRELDEDIIYPPMTIITPPGSMAAP
jgi:hypothetical protein